MSMIYGFINLDGRPADPAILKNMESALADKKHDAQSALVSANVAMGFKNQYITEESHFEALPYHDAETGLYFVCDAIIDNREELAALLGLRLTKETPDGRFIFEAYKKWGERCTDHLLGDFAFVVYDSRNRRAQLFRDHMGKRILYYRRAGETIFFSTLMKPLIDPWGSGQKPELNEEYLVYFFAMQGVRQDIIPERTIFQEINYVSPGCYLIVSGQSVPNEVYWNPQDIHADPRYKKKDFIEEFKKIYTDAVRSRLRTDGEVGIFLSGGLDSSSAACVAAPILQDRNKQLYTYTSVPIRRFVDWTPRHLITDESSSIRMMQRAYPNMISHFIDADGKNPLNVSDTMLDIQEQPYKFIDNSYWLDDIFQTASQDGCKIILSGSFGNSTISYGTYRVILFEHLMRFRWFSFVQYLSKFCLCNSFSRKRLFFVFASACLNSFIRFRYSPLASELVRSDYLRKYKVENTLKSYGFTNKPILRVRDSRRLVFNPAIMHQISFAPAKFSLAYNTCERDPTSDKRVVEFCLRLPYECYFDKTKGCDRGLIRQAMSGVVPDEILYNRLRGIQAPDWIQRIEPEWNGFINSFREDLYNKNSLYSCLDADCIMKLINRNAELKYSINTAIDVRNIITINNCIKLQNML
ncbi:MAG: hypothetical protein GXY05_12035 [Clostridiales bacterium]|nr:hypothetical protein [Clostridiales bacterium]